MPNHVINEVIFRSVTAEQQAAILSKVGSPEASVDFAVLLPIPLNHWQWSVGTKHEEAFPGNALDWCSANWSTKWNAYGLSDNERGDYQTISHTDDTLTLTFKTAWRAPVGWLCALFNTFNLPIEYRYLSEGSEQGMVGTFAPETSGSWGAQWDEVNADEATGRHLHKLLWGVEEFEDE